MTLFIDASALVAIIAREAEADRLSDVMEADEDRLCSAVSLWETVAALVHRYAFTVEGARKRVQLYREILALRFVTTGEAEFEFAIDAYARFGEGRHPAALNMGDCHAYACARAHGATLLFKGDDFPQTDISQPAPAP